METDPDKIVAELTIEEKAYLLSGMSFWGVRGIERFGLDVIILADGPHGLRKQTNIHEDTLGMNEAIKAICFPTASATACSFNTKLLYDMGQYLGQECQAEDVQVILGPGTNIKRTPLCGRNFEYFSEDPFLSSKLAKAWIEGVQSQGVGTSLKHYVANNQEKRRMTINAIVDERALREIYLASFEEPIRDAKPWTVMGSYNRLNGKYVCQNSYFLRDILRNEWDYEGVLVSDWGAIDELVTAVEEGMDLEMPSSGDVGPQKIIKAVKQGKLNEEVLDGAARNMVQLLIKANQAKSGGEYSQDVHHAKAWEIARECVVLLKNEDDILPVTADEYQSVAIIGEFAKNPRFQGGGSSHINPSKVDNVFHEFSNLSTDLEVKYAQGYEIASDDTNDELLQEAKALAKASDVVLVFAGLPDRYETEGVDRDHLNLPPNHLELIDELLVVNQNVVIILSAGSVVKMPFVDKTKGIVMSWLVGQAGAGAIAEILLGMVNPSGKLAESFIKKEDDDPSYANYPGDEQVNYEEGILVGYRYHDQFKTDLGFEFGFGLSYSTFEYSNLKLSKTKMVDTETLEVSVDVTNSGPMAGKEIVQLYIAEKDPVVIRPVKELKGFEKVHLDVDETKTVTITLNKRSFAYFNTDISDWYVNTGKFEILIGKSSKDIVLQQEIIVESSVNLPQPPSDEKVYRKRFDFHPSQRITRNTRMELLKEHAIGTMIYKQMIGQAIETLQDDYDDDSEKNFDMTGLMAMIDNTPVRSFVNLTKGDAMSDRGLKRLIFLLNLTRPNTPLGRIFGVFRRS